MEKWVDLLHVMIDEKLNKYHTDSLKNIVRYMRKYQKEGKPKSIIKGWTINTIIECHHKMPCMYFSGVDSKAITTEDDPNSRCIRVNAELYDKVQNYNEQNTRFF